jgi:hypothetical protein
VKRKKKSKKNNILILVKFVIYLPLKVHKMATPEKKYYNTLNKNRLIWSDHEKKMK